MERLTRVSLADYPSGGQVSGNEAMLRDIVGPPHAREHGHGVPVCGEVRVL